MHTDIGEGRVPRGLVVELDFRNDVFALLDFADDGTTDEGANSSRGLCS